MNTDQKLDKILTDITDIKIGVAKHLVHQENHAKDIEELKKYKEQDAAFKNKAVGALAVLNVVLVSIGHWIAKHI